MAMTYDERVEQAIGANDVEALVKYIYGYPCHCKYDKRRAAMRLQNAGKRGSSKSRPFAALQR
jgi:hypothetical protein